MTEKAQIEILTRRVDELQGQTVALKTALLLAFTRLAEHASQSHPQCLAEECASLCRGLHQSADFYAEHALATAIPDAHIEQAQKVLSELASVLQ